MHQGMLVFAQVMAHLPLSTFRRCVSVHRGDYKVQEFSCLDQFFAMAFAQLTARESLRDIEVNLRAQSTRLYHMGFRCKTIARNTLAHANATRPWQIYADFAQHLVGIARPLYAGEALADSMYEGVILVGGEIASLGNDAVIKSPLPEDVGLIEEACRANRITPPSRLRRIVAGRKLWNFHHSELETWREAL